MKEGSIHFDGILTIVQDVFDFSVLVGNLNAASDLARSEQLVIDAALLEDLGGRRVQKNGRA